MKQYEKMEMSTEAALKWVKECAIRYCRDCPAFETQELRDVCASKYLLSEVQEPPKVPRWMTAKTQEDFKNLFADFLLLCREQDGCRCCDYNSHGIGTPCVYGYLSELVDAPESEVDNGET